MNSVHFTLFLGCQGIEPQTDKSNSFTENHHYQSDHQPLRYSIIN